MGTRAQINIRKDKEVVRVYIPLDGYPEVILPVLHNVAITRRSKPLSIAQAIVEEFPDDVRIIDKEDDQSKYVSYRYNVNVSSKPWRVRETKAEVLDLPTKPDGSLDYSTEALENAPVLPAVTRNIRIGA
jgi:hypothetical protein